MKNGLCPGYLSSLVPQTVENNTAYSLRNASDYKYIRSNTQLYYNSFLSSVVRDWNELPHTSRNTPNITAFKRSLNSTLTGVPLFYLDSKRIGQIHHFRLRMDCSSLMPRSHIHGSPRRFHYGSNPTDDLGNDHFRIPMRMHNTSTTTYDYRCNTEIYGLIRIATDDAGSYPWLILRRIRECVTWALITTSFQKTSLTVSFAFVVDQKLPNTNCLIVIDLITCARK